MLDAATPVEADGIVDPVSDPTVSDPAIWHARGVAWARDGVPAMAAHCLARASLLAPARFDYAAHAAEAASLAGQGTAALDAAERRLAADPADPVAMHALAVLLQHARRWDEAIDMAEAASALRPDAPEPAALRGRLLVRTLRIEEAEAALARACALAPDDAHLANDHAVALLRMERYGAARDRFEALAALPGAGEMELANLANARLAVGEQAAAMAAAEAAAARAPDSPTGARAIASTLAYLPGVTGAALRDALITCGALHARAPVPEFANDRDPDRRLRLGILSGTFKTHPVGWLATAGLEALDRASFEIVALANNTAHDWLGRRFQAMAARWVRVDALSDADLAQRGRDLGIDILIDLGGYGDHGRMPACALRIAPVQVKWVGSQYHTSGLAEMDWLVTDDRETPPGTEPFYVERLLRLPDGYVCYTAPPDAPAVTAPPALAAGGAVTFGCFNNLAKLNDTVVAVWADILRRVPDSRLLLKARQFADPPTVSATVARFVVAGVAADRIAPEPGAAHRAFLERYGAVDIALDPFPYSGGLTTCEAMLMGVPVLTLPGETFASRHSLSHLHNVGLGPEWVATDAADYVAKAAAAAADLPALAALRHSLRPRVLASPLCDAPRFGAHLGAALRRAWRAWCAS